MRTLYPALEPYATHHVERDGHLVYVEECGNPEGYPVLFLHGGPGSGCKPYHRCFFNPSLYRIILLDQRGSGRSTPFASLADNTTQHLLGDLDHIWLMLGVSRWLLFGGSWGATLALLYAQQHPEKVSGLILRGAFLARQADMDWFLGAGGVRRIYPEDWDICMAGIPECDDSDRLAVLHRLMSGEDELAQRRAARAWSMWGGRVTVGDDFDMAQSGHHVSHEVLAQARLELHYALNRYFIGENDLLASCERIAHLPVTLLHGRRDLVCPVESAWVLHQSLPDSTLRILPQAGHLASGEDMIDALVTATDEMLIRLGLPV